MQTPYPPEVRPQPRRRLGGFFQIVVGSTIRPIDSRLLGLLGFRIRGYAPGFHRSFTRPGKSCAVSDDPYGWDERVEAWEEVATSESFLAIRDRMDGEA
jgi:hypothetical protein